jgi:hypothetical protein
VVVGVLPVVLVLVCVFGVVVVPVVVRGVVVVPVVVVGGGVVVVAGGVVVVGVVSAGVVVVPVVVVGGGVVVVVVPGGSVVDVVSAGVVSRLTNSACDAGSVRLTVAPTVPSTLVTSCLPGRNTILPSKILPLSPSPRACCSSLTAAVVAACQVSSTTIPSGL